jgi:UDP-3-O-[3-hydroxymyristoyl] glucosamine N-acyltransferase
VTAMTLGEIALAIGGTVDGDPLRLVERVRGIETAGSREIAVVFDRRYFAAIDRCGAEALVIPEDWGTTRTNVIRVPDPGRSLAPLAALFARSEARPGIDPHAFVAPSAALGTDVSIAACAHVGENVCLGDRVRIHANAVIGDDCVFGDDCVIHPNVTIYPRSRLGNRVVVHAGTVIGSDGFGFVHGERIPQVGIVEIEDDVEIGANCTIDRATFEVTRIGAGTKIDNLVQVGHNSDIGPHCVLVGQSGIAGSVTLGAGVQLGGQSGVSDHTTVGPGVRIGAKSGVHSDIAEGEWLGSPAQPRELAGRIFAILPHLPEYRERVRELEARVEELQKIVAALLAKNEVADRTDS